MPETMWTLSQQLKWKLAKWLRDMAKNGVELDPMPSMASTLCFGILGDATVTQAQMESFATAIATESQGAIRLQVVGGSIPAPRPTRRATPISSETAPDIGHGTLPKFPRTRHLLPSGGVTRDDLVLDPMDARRFVQTRVTLQEKVDGANLGLFLNDDFTIVAQNRSHFCNSSTAPQFKGLDIWIQVHQFELIELLSPPGRYVLYGEWLFAQHSIGYTRLPSYFLAFDVLDRQDNSFWSVERVAERLQETSIHMVPTLPTTTLADFESYQRLLETPSAFYDGPVEGIVIRCEADGILADRAKLVRDDFIQEIGDHWAKKGVVKNQLHF
ncbi:hypothetical protein SPRG_11049 [Saprolegnia parasitica CBS 223.65]|uniref:RNA ligase domain-containing protein n=1 Tax=Saprolegnia parasitica (strain CBS 223.65) TaxID=695850 RepID=A0A067BWK7_SAPPC|nr:hypothetical protein SPRG_11049 [Saprolegnia parasitica CBS 223.65]KDO21190.1 hypothetical protein SPRG_11049 [Saprolegnia parasitica CBS 223.65]|eukprot:XP_012208100.1 hypothetical protein SPRG_11049 [Saprolegnia parasitica CBS 223.65]